MNKSNTFKSVKDYNKTKIILMTTGFIVFFFFTYLIFLDIFTSNDFSEETIAKYQKLEESYYQSLLR